MDIDKYYKIIESSTRSVDLSDASISTINKEYYLDIIEKCYKIYMSCDDVISNETIEFYSPLSDIQSYSRIITTLATLLSNGRMQNKMNVFCKMMDKATACINDLSLKKDQKIDFAVKELALSFYFVRDLFKPSVIQNWKNALSDFDPCNSYKFYNRAGNINLYACAGEWLRTACNMTDARDFISNSWERQREWFDENGMYMDNYLKDPRHNPILYDLTTRVQLELMLDTGYDGEKRTEIEAVLVKGGMMSLLLQSATGEIAAGGRSNRYVFNEMLSAACFEYQAKYYKSKNNLKLAGVFKSAAHKSIKSVENWIQCGRHIKNNYPNEMIDGEICCPGTEKYGYYTKYMISAAAFLSLAVLFADDSIDECDCKLFSEGNYLVKTSDSFNIVNITSNGYTLEFITDADYCYDSKGLVSIRKEGVHTELGCALGFTDKPKYCVLPNTKTGRFSICSGFLGEKTKMKDAYISALNDIKMKFIFDNEYKATYGELCFEIEYCIPKSLGGGAITEKYKISSSGIDIKTKITGETDNRILFNLPLLRRTGPITPEDCNSDLEIKNNEIKLKYRGSCLTVCFDENIKMSLSDDLYFNRSGEYLMARFECIENRENEIHLRIVLK